MIERVLEDWASVYRLTTGLARYASLFSLCVTIVAAIAFVTPVSAGPVENRALVDAAWDLDIEAVKEALASGANGDSYSLYFVNRQPVTAIGAVARASPHELRFDSDVIEERALVIANLLFEHGAEIGPHDLHILHIPVYSGQKDLVTLLLKKGASPTARDLGYTPTELASKWDEKAIYDLLIANGGKAVTKRNAAQIALVEAVQSDKHFKMRQAIKDGAHINDPDVSGTTPLLSALDKPVYDADHAASVRWVIENGADVNRRGKASGFDDANEMALHLFVRRNPLSMNGDDENARWDAEQTLLLILEAGAKVSGMDAKDMTPLHWAAKADNLRAAEILIEAGSRISPRDMAGKQPLDYAESASMIKLLKDYGAME